MIKVSVQGARGRLGSKIVECIEASEDFLYAGNIEKNGAIPECDVVVAVAGSEALEELLQKMSGQKLVIGSTGNLPIFDIERYSKEAGVFLVPNFSHGMQIVYKLAKTLLNEDLQNFKPVLKDIHHVHKKDSPSGTAKNISSLLKEKRIAVEIESERTGEALGAHSLILENEYERVTISHEVLSRDVYAQGCLIFIKEIMNVTSGLYRK